MITSVAVLLLAFLWTTEAVPSLDPTISTGTQDLEAVAKRVDLHLKRLESMGYSGGVLMGSGHKVILAKGYGYAERETQRPFTTKTLFTIGSIVKPITGLAMAKLWEMGKIDFQQPLTDFLENVPDDKKGITVHHLLTHSAGLPGAVGYDYAACSRDELVGLAMKSELMFSPGSSYNYSNVGFSLCAAILEKITETPYDEFVEEHVYGPSGMKRTGYRLSRFLDNEFAHGYSGTEHWGLPRDKYWTEEGPSWHLVGNGGIVSNLEDMFCLHVALEDNTILGDEAKALVLTPHVSEGGGTYYGYGWSIDWTPDKKRVIQHNGGNPYFSNDFRRYVDDGFVYYIHSNDGAWGAPEISDHIHAAILGNPSPLPPEVVAINGEELDGYAGIFELESGDQIEFKVSGKALEVVPRGDEAFCAAHCGRRVDIPSSKRARALITKELDNIDTSMQGSQDLSISGLVARLSHHLGTFHNAEILGVTPAIEEQAPKDALIVHVRFAFKDDARIVKALVGNSRLMGFDLQMPTNPRAYPLGGGRFATYDMMGGTPVEFQFDMDGDIAVSMMIESVDGEIVADRH